MTAYSARAATRDEFELAEGIIWDDRSRLVRWVDIEKGRVHSIFLADVGTTGLPVPRWAGSTNMPYWQQKEAITT